MVLLCFWSCKNSKSLAETEGLYKSNKVVFVNYKLFRLANGKRQLSYLNHTIKEGRLKRFTTTTPGKPNDLICIQYNNRYRKLHSVLIKDPLRKIMEHIDDEKQLQTQVLELDEAFFSVRMQLHPQTRFIAVRNFSEEENLMETPINQE